MTFDPVRIFAVLAAHDVDYLTIGGVAAITHGVRRMTLDLDIAPEPSDANLSRLEHALAELGARKLLPGEARAPITGADLAVVALGTTLHTQTDHGALDVVGAPAGAAPYPQLSQRAVTVALGELTVPIVGLDDLIAMKRAAGRDTDLRDIAELTRS